MDKPITKAVLTQTLIQQGGLLANREAFDPIALVDFFALIESAVLYEKLLYLKSFGLYDQYRLYTELPLPRLLISEGILQDFQSTAEFASNPQLEKAVEDYLDSLLGSQPELKPFIRSAAINTHEDGFQDTTTSPKNFFFRIRPNVIQLFNDLQGGIQPGEAINRFRSHEGQVDIATLFVVRTYRYWAFSEATGIPLVPDRSRAPLIWSQIEAQRQGFPRQAYKIIANEFKITAQQAYEMANTHILNIPPVALLVLSKAKGDYKSIPDAVMDIRKFLSPSRDRLTEIEFEIRSAKNYKSFKAALQRKKRAFDAILDSTGTDWTFLKWGLKTASSSLAKHSPTDRGLTSVDLLLELGGKIWHLWNRRPVASFISLKKKAERVDDLNGLLVKTFGQNVTQSDLLSVALKDDIKIGKD